jgi:hypothetical protein
MCGTIVVAVMIDVLKLNRFPVSNCIVGSPKRVLFSSGESVSEHCTIMIVVTV